MKCVYEKITLPAIPDRQQIAGLYSDFPYFFLADSGSKRSELPPEYCQTDWMAAGGVQEIRWDGTVLNTLLAETQKNKPWLFGYLSYEWKNQLEDLQSLNRKIIASKTAAFFIASFVLKVYGDEATLWYNPEEINRKDLLRQIQQAPISEPTCIGVEMKSLCEQKEYLEKFHALRNHLLKGDSYEITFCRAWEGSYVNLSIPGLYLQMQQEADAPFSCLLKMKELSVVCLSPERFLKKQGSKLISQPIKGTSRRGLNTEEDNELARQLKKSPKEKAENLMIADLVRNDLSRFAIKGSVRAPEVAAVYPFRYVHQMISTIEAELRPEASGIQALAACFPPGSMTGAPKIRTMQIIEEQENFARGIYSGSIGYISPESDYDFNVVIRSVLIDTEQKKLMVAAGGAITVQSDAQEEFKETTLKAESLLRNLGVEKTGSIHD